MALHPFILSEHNLSGSLEDGDKAVQAACLLKRSKQKEHHCVMFEELQIKRPCLLKLLSMYLV